MKAKDFFRRVRQLHTEMLSLQRTIDDMRAMYGLHGLSGGEPVQMTKAGKPVEDAVLKVIGVEEHLRDQMGALADMLETAILMIDSLPEPDDRKIMRYYYINGLTCCQTAELAGCSERQVWRALLRALDQLDALDMPDVD